MIIIKKGYNKIKCEIIFNSHIFTCTITVRLSLGIGLYFILHYKLVEFSLGVIEIDT